MLIDTHIHLDSEAYEGDLPEVLARARAAGLGAFVIPGADLASLPRAVQIAQANEDVYFASGVHPYDLGGLLGGDLAVAAGATGGAETGDGEAAAEPAAAGAGALEQLANASELPQSIAAQLSSFDLQYLDHPKCCAIGECGLDYFRKPSPAQKRAQQIAFARHCEISCERDLPIILHVREANEDAAAIVREFPNLRGVFHCFNASALLLEFAERFYYGIGGVLTFKNARALGEILPKVPLERLLIETDGPYLAPHPHRGSRNESAFCTLVRDKICEILGHSAEQIEQISSQNARDLFHI